MERTTKGTDVIKSGGEKTCKICTSSLSVDNFSAPQLRKDKSACNACCAAGQYNYYS